MKAGDCVHFRGIQHETCAAGVRMLDVRDASGKGPYRWPCLPSVKLNKTEPCRTTCPKFAAMTREQEREQDAADRRAVEAAIGGLCPMCGETCKRIEGERSTVLVCSTHGEVMRECRHVEEP